jgi:biopolymer transport protein ExbD
VALSAQRVRSKVRNAVRRREDQIEQEEIESGELNLIPYLDMVTNLMLFLLASVATGIVFTQIDTQLPDHAPPSSSVAPPATDPDDQPLKMIVSIKRDNIILWSITGLEGTIQAPKDVIGRTGRDNADCDGNYMCEGGFCSDQRKCTVPVPPAVPPQPTPVFDYRKLNNDLIEIANRRYNGKQRKPDTYQIILQASPEIPFNTIASVMAALRCKMPDFGKEAVACAMPTDDPDLHKAKDPISPDKTLFDTTRAAYDPSKMALFSDILFSAGFE